MVILMLTLFVGSLTLASGRATIFQGAVHLVIFGVFLLLAAVKRDKNRGRRRRRRRPFALPDLSRLIREDVVSRRHDSISAGDLIL